MERIVAMVAKEARVLKAELVVVSDPLGWVDIAETTLSPPHLDLICNSRVRVLVLWIIRMKHPHFVENNDMLTVAL